jgi:hypothetical protein
MPRGRSLYGTLPDQLADPQSFVSGLRRILEVREASEIATATQLDVPAVSHKAMLVMVHGLPSGARQVTVLNFSQEPISGTVHSEHLEAGSTIRDLFSGKEIGEVDDLNSFSVTLDPHEGLALEVTAPAPAD